MKLHWIFNRYLRPADDGTDLGGGSVDRGDDFTPTGDDTPAKVTKAAPADATAADDADTTAADDADENAEETGARTKRKDTRIPLDRHKTILDRERRERAEERDRMQAELARYKQGEKIADANKQITEAETRLTEKEDRYEQLLSDGKLAEAKVLRQEIRNDQTALNTARIEMTTAAVEARAVESVRYDMTVERLEVAYPQINPDHEDFDRAKTAEVLDLKAAFQARGETPSKALQKAVKYVFPAETSTQRKAVDTEARVDRETAQEAIEKARKSSATKKNLDAATKQPPNLKNVGVDHDKLGGKLTAQSVLKMDYESFNKLDDAALSALRGDENDS